MSARSVAMQQNYVRRRVMAVFSHGPTKYLAMVVEKSKVSVYQFSHLLKQVCDRHPVQGTNGQSDTHSGSSGSSAPTKLMLPCHGSVTVSFAVSSIVVNPLREGMPFCTIFWAEHRTSSCQLPFMKICLACTCIHALHFVWTVSCMQVLGLFPPFYIFSTRSVFHSAVLTLIVLDRSVRVDWR